MAPTRWSRPPDNNGDNNDDNIDFEAADDLRRRSSSPSPRRTRFRSKRTLASFGISPDDDANAISTSIAPTTATTTANAIIHDATLAPRATTAGTIPATYGNINNSPSPGAVVGIVLGSVAGFLLFVFLVWACINLGRGNDPFWGRSSRRTESVVAMSEHSVWDTGSSSLGSFVSRRRRRERLERIEREKRERIRRDREEAALAAAAAAAGVHRHHSRRHSHRERPIVVEARRHSKRVVSPHAAPPPPATTTTRTTTTRRIIKEVDHDTDSDLAFDETHNDGPDAGPSVVREEVLVDPVTGQTVRRNTTTTTKTVRRPAPDSDDDDADMVQSGEDEVVVIEEGGPQRHHSKASRRSSRR